jgi:hypothetical protein
MALTMPIFDIATRQLNFLLADLIHPNDLRAKVLTDAGLRYKLRVYTLGLEDILSGQGTEAAQAAGWCLLAGNGPKHAVAAELTEGQTPQMVSISDVSQAHQVNQAIDAIHKLLTTQPALDPNAHYELAMLQIPALVWEAYWLKADKGGADWVFPYQTFITTPAQDTAWLASEYFQNPNILALVRKRLDSYDTTGHANPDPQPPPPPGPGGPKRKK